MNKAYYSQGWTLVELMITVAIIGVLAAIAVPSYHSYISTSQTGAAKQNAITLLGFEDTYFYENDTYLAGEYTPGGVDTLTAALEWNPTGDNIFKYSVVAGSCGDIADCYTITVTLINDTSISQSISGP